MYNTHKLAWSFNNSESLSTGKLIGQKNRKATCATSSPADVVIHMTSAEQVTLVELRVLRNSL